MFKLFAFVLSVAIMSVVLISVVTFNDLNSSQNASSKIIVPISFQDISYPFLRANGNTNLGTDSDLQKNSGDYVDITSVQN